MGGCLLNIVGQGRHGIPHSHICFRVLQRRGQRSQALAGRRQQNLVDVGSSILGGLLGGRGRARKLATAARRVASGRRQTSATSARLDSARSRVAEKIDQLEDLELDLAEALMEIDDEWSSKALTIEEVEVPLEKSDISVEDFSLVWLAS